jgi:pimeloyl-ACP methyl ester carboxylesterase
VISGRYDEATPGVQQALVSGLRQAEQVILEESSHMPFWEERNTYMSHVRKFLSQRD